MPKPLILLSIPGLREKDVARMRQLANLTAGGELAELTPSFPCVTCPVQAAMTTGRPASEHGVIANGFYWRDKNRVEMWTSPNDCIARPQIWDLLSQHDETLHSAAWFPLHIKHADAEYICTPAPIHRPDHTESLWCYTRPDDLYGTLRDEFGHFPLQHFWGPMANVASSAWIAASAVYAAKRWRPPFFYIYLPHLDYAAQRLGPDSEPAQNAVIELDTLIGKMAAGMAEAYGQTPVWLVAGEYAITEVDHVTYPNRVLREAGLLSVREEEGAEHLDTAASRAWAMVDHQFSHVFVANHDPQVAEQVAELFRSRPGIAEVLVGSQLERYQLYHERSGDVVLISSPESWQAYYWWFDKEKAPKFARSVDIHRKPGYDPVELFLDPHLRCIPLTPELVRGSHGAPAVDASQKTVLVASQPLMTPGRELSDTDVFEIVMRHFGIGK